MNWKTIQDPSANGQEHTVGEFIEFCVHGRTDKSAEWTSKGVGKPLGRKGAEGSATHG